MTIHLIGNSGSDFRHRHQAPAHNSPLSPERFNPVEAANLRYYLEGMDGKGDHDCK